MIVRYWWVFVRNSKIVLIRLKQRTKWKKKNTLSLEGGVYKEEYRWRRTGAKKPVIKMVIFKGKIKVALRRRMSFLWTLSKFLFSFNLETSEAWEVKPIGKGREELEWKRNGTKTSE